MRKIVLAFALVLVVNLVFGQQSDVFSGTAGTPVLNPVPALMQPKLQSSGAVLFDNGPLVTNPGGGAGGADASLLQTALSMNIYGAGCQLSFDNRLADDFTLTDSKRISTIILYGYQTGSSTVPTINSVYIRIYDRQPNLPGATVIWGNRITNRLTEASFSGIYRAADYDPTNTARPIMRLSCNVDVSLAAGTYWLEYSFNGTLSSGPWCPPVTISGQTTTGNAMQYIPAYGWNSYVDSGTLTVQGMPFILMGAPAIPFKIWYLAFVFIAIAAGVVVKRRFF